MTILIIGGGWSGLAAAITCIQQGHSVQLVESAKQLGGRARNVIWDGRSVDNGQHLMIGAYQRMLSIMQSISIDPEVVFQRCPINIVVHDPRYPILRLSAQGNLPWSWSLAWNMILTTGFTGLRQLLRVQRSIGKVLLAPDISVSEWLQQQQQSKRLVAQLWEPLCLATLNTPIDQASAHQLAIILQDSLGQGQSAADLLIPRQTLGDIFPKIAADYIKQQGSKINLQTRVKRLVVEQGKIAGAITNNDQLITADTIIIATHLSQCRTLLSPYIDFPKPVEYPIYTVYLQYPDTTRLAEPMIGISGMLSQWVFDRSEQTAGLIAVVISGPGSHQQMTKQILIDHICVELKQLFPDLPAQVQDALVISEKRATFACTVDFAQHRPSHQTAIDGLWLAGDYVTHPYPATIEAAVANGEQCAKLMLQNKNDR